MLKIAFLNYKKFKINNYNFAKKKSFHFAAQKTDVTLCTV